MSSSLSVLKRELPLPLDWSEPQVVHDCVEMEGLCVHRVGVSARNGNGIEITGSAAGVDRLPLDRAWFELIERAAIVDAREPGYRSAGDQRPARSNGVAVGRSWTDACIRACHELAERDRVLRSWYGEITPVRVSAPDWLASSKSHRWEAYELGAGPAWCPNALTALVLGFPRRPALPLARGSAARPSRAGAVEAAAREAIQSLAFLWNEPLPQGPPDTAPTAMFHLDYYLDPETHGAIRAWLDGRHRMYARERDARAGIRVRFKDLTPYFLSKRLRVARAVSTSAASLKFGRAPLSIPAPLRVHPIP